MSVIGHIVYREWSTRVRRKAFIWGTLAVPILLSIGIGLGVWSEQSNTQNSKVLVVDISGLITRWDDRIAAWVPNCPDCFPERAELEYRFAPEALADSVFLESDFDFMILFDDAILQHQKAKLLYDKAPAVSLKSRVENDLNQAIERFRVKEELAMDYATYQRIKVRVRLVGEDVRTREGQALERSVIGFFFSLFIFFQILVYGMHVLRGVIEEKSNRIVEVIVSMVRPSQLMTGKVIGIGLVGLTQFVILSVLGWVSFAGGAVLVDAMGWLAVEDAVVTADFRTWISGHEKLGFLFQVNWPLMLVSTAGFYAAGFTLYAACFAAVGAAVEQESDAQYLLLPVMLPLLVSYLLATLSLENPEGMLSVVGSWIPFTAPVMMLVRLPNGVPWWEVLLSLSGVVLTALLMLKVAGKIYRIGILMYGKKANWMELFRWLRHQN